MYLGHGGNVAEASRLYGIPEESILDFSASINPLPLPEAAISATQKALGKLRDYPDIAYANLLQVIGGRYGLPTGNLLVGNGSTEHIYLLPQLLKPRKTCVVVPSYNDYTEAFGRFSGEVLFHCLTEEQGFRLDFAAFGESIEGCDAVVLGSPNNPTGIAVGKAPLLELISRKPETTFVVDEAFMDFLGDDTASLLNESTEMPNLVVLRSLTKFYGIPGVRLAFLSAAKETIANLRKIQQTWTVNCFAEAIGIALLKDREFQRKTIETVRIERDFLFQSLSALDGLEPVSSDANFLLVKVGKVGLDSQKLWEKLAPTGILIRRCGNFRGLDARWFRIAVRLRSDNEKMIAALKAALSS